MAIHEITSAPILLVGLCLLASACSQEPEPEPAYEPNVEIEINPDVDLSVYTSFDLADPRVEIEGEPPPAFDEVKAQLEQAVVDELTSKGLVRDTEAPELIVNPFVSVAEVSDYSQFYAVYYGWYYGYDYLWTVKYDYTEGSLLLDVIDQGDPADIGDDLLVYRGVADGLMAEDVEVIKLEIRNATRAIFGQWPAQSPD